MNLEPVNYFHIGCLIFAFIMLIWIKIESNYIDKTVEPNRLRPRKDIRKWDLENTI